MVPESWTGHRGHIHDPTSAQNPPTPPTHTHKNRKKKTLPFWTRVASSQLRLRSKFIVSPWQHQGNKQQCLDRSWYLPNAQNSPPPPGSFRKEVSAAAKCVVNRAGWGWPLALARSDQHLHPPMIKAEDAPCQGPGQRGQDRQMNSECSVILMCPDPIVFFYNPKWTLPVPLITLGRTTSFHRGVRTKEALP